MDTFLVGITKTNKFCLPENSKSIKTFKISYPSNISTDAARGISRALMECGYSSKAYVPNKDLERIEDINKHLTNDMKYLVLFNYGDFSIITPINNIEDYVSGISALNEAFSSVKKNESWKDIKYVKLDNPNTPITWDLLDMSEHHLGDVKINDFKVDIQPVTL